jgi:D-sedoheptulose 7-phosphate isomerase
MLIESQNVVLTELQESADLLQAFMNNPAHVQSITYAAQILITSIEQGHKVISCGNGGSHCDAMHFAEELSGKYRNHRKALPAFCISDTSHISCVGNDYGFDFVFSRFIEGLGQEGDVLLGLSTSGNSENVLNAVKAAREKGMKVILLTGKDGGKMAGIADVEIRVPHFGFADRIQEVHIKVIHILMLLIEKGLNLA